MRIRSCIILATAVIAFFALARSTDRQDGGRNEADRINQQISELERRWRQAVVDRDRSALDSILAERFGQQGSAGAKIKPGAQLGIIARQEYLDGILNGEPQHYNLEGAVKVAIRDSVTVIAGFKLVVSPARPAAQESSSAYRVCDVIDAWVRTPDGWRVSAREVDVASEQIPVLSKGQNR